MAVSRILAAAALPLALAARIKYNTGAKRVDAPGVLNVHIVAHTHDDVGWLKTVDEYYAGLNNTIQHASVRHILDSTLDSLRKNPDRKFVSRPRAYSILRTCPPRPAQSPTGRTRGPHAVHVMLSLFDAVFDF